MLAGSSNVAFIDSADHLNTGEDLLEPSDERTGTMNKVMLMMMTATDRMW